MVKYIYVDTENVSTPSWYHIVKYLTPRDMLVIPWSVNSQPMKLNVLADLGFPRCRVNFVECHTGTPNAMDFVLVSLLTQHVLAAPKSLHLLISKDHGYDPAIDHLIRTTGARIRRHSGWGEYMSHYRYEVVDGKWVG